MPQTIHNPLLAEQLHRIEGAALAAIAQTGAISGESKVTVKGFAVNGGYFAVALLYCAQYACLIMETVGSKHYFGQNITEDGIKVMVTSTGCVAFGDLPNGDTGFITISFPDQGFDKIWGLIDYIDSSDLELPHALEIIRLSMDVVAESKERAQ